MSNQLKMLVGAALFAVLAFVGMLGVFTFSGAQPVQAQQNTTAMRSLDPERVAPGGSVTVKIRVGQASKIIETLPDGFTYAGSSIDDPDDDNDVLTVGQTVTFTPIGERSFTYTVTAPETEDEYTFSGVAQFNTDRDNDLPVGGASTVTVTVEAVLSGDPLVNRYDANGNGTIEKSEVIAAINDYLFGEGDQAISKAEVIKLINNFLQDNLLQRDREVLVALYNATDGPNWKNRDNWLSDKSIDQWRGVTTDEDGRVTVLILNLNYLTGEIPPEIGNLASLRHLDLSSNQLTGGIPPELASLTGLQFPETVGKPADRQYSAGTR